MFGVHAQVSLYFFLLWARAHSMGAGPYHGPRPMGPGPQSARVIVAPNDKTCKQGQDLPPLAADAKTCNQSQDSQKMKRTAVLACP